jgi:hypothetical protein
MNLGLLIWGVVVVMAVTAFIGQRVRRQVRIDANGVLFVRSLAKPLYLPWVEINRFGIASVIEVEGGLYQPGSTQYVGVELADSSRMKSTKACVDNRKLSDYDVLLTPDRGMSVDEFAAHLEKERAKFKHC